MAWSTQHWQSRRRSTVWVPSLIEDLPISTFKRSGVGREVWDLLSLLRKLSSNSADWNCQMCARTFRLHCNVLRTTHPKVRAKKYYLSTCIHGNSYKSRTTNRKFVEAKASPLLSTNGKTELHIDYLFNNQNGKRCKYRHSEGTNERLQIRWR